MNTFLLPFVVFASWCFNNNDVLAAKFPSEIEFCHQSDPNFNNCVATQMTKALMFFKDGSSELGIPKLDPFEIPKMEIISNTSRPVALNQQYTNMLTYGISTSKVDEPKFEVNKEKCFWDLVVLSPHMRVQADYVLTGQLLVLPINGHGKCNITLTNLRQHQQASCEFYQKKGKTYMRLTKYTIEMRAETVEYSFENIVPGNKQISDEIQKTMNENSQEIFIEVKYGFESVWSQLHLQAANNVLAKIPANEIFPE